MERTNLQNKINEIKGTDKVNQLVAFMQDNGGYNVDQFMNVETADKKAVALLEKYFSGEVAVDGAVVNGEGLDLEQISKMKKKARGGKNSNTSENKGGKKSNNKKEDNIVEFKKEQEQEQPSEILEDKGQGAEGDSNNDGANENENPNPSNENGEQTPNNESNENSENNENADGNSGEDQTPNNEGGDSNQNPSNDNKGDGNKDDDGKGKDGKSEEEKPKKETDAQIAKKYKTTHNIVDKAVNKKVVLDDVKEVSETSEDLIYSCDLRGGELASMFLSGELVYDPSMQRGLKEDSHGDMIANFKDYHVREIYESMKNNSFTATQIHLGVILDDGKEDPTFEWYFNGETKQFAVNGKIRLIDGQHRSRALAKIVNELKVGRIQNVDIDKYVFNVQIHVTSAEYARIIYSNIDKNLKLDKSQVRQLSSDHYSKIVNALNLHSDSPLKGKISTSKPVGTKLVLFSNIAEAIEDTISISSAIKREEVTAYLKKFFDYVAYKFPNDAFGNEKKMAEFRKNNLLVENNAFKMWVKVAFLNEEEYKKNVDHIISNIEYFNKDHEGTVTINGEQKSGHIWLLLNTVKHKQKGEGFAMNNTNNGINAITNQVLAMLGANEPQGGDK